VVWKCDWLFKPIFKTEEKGGFMASNFTISILRKGQNLHFNLYGDFDGSSAAELNQAIKANCRDVSLVYIHTDKLSDRIHSFGQRIFHTDFKLLMKKPYKLIFTGRYADKLNPAESEFSQ